MWLRCFLTNGHVSRRESSYCGTGNIIVKQRHSILAVTVRPGVTLSDLNELLPEYLCGELKESLRVFGRKLPGFDCADAMLTGIESRSSSPVRIVRDPETMESISLPGMYPIGEGAGYAGGIMSAAMDGIKAAKQLCFFSDLYLVLPH